MFRIKNSIIDLKVIRGRILIVMLIWMLWIRLKTASHLEKKWYNNKIQWQIYQRGRVRKIKMSFLNLLAFIKIHIHYLRCLVKTKMFRVVIRKSRGNHKNSRISSITILKELRICGTAVTTKTIWLVDWIKCLVV